MFILLSKREIAINIIHQYTKQQNNIMKKVFPDYKLKGNVQSQCFNPELCRMPYVET